MGHVVWRWKILSGECLELKLIMLSGDFFPIKNCTKLPFSFFILLSLQGINLEGIMCLFVFLCVCASALS